MARSSKWQNIAFALEQRPISLKLTPKMVSVNEVFSRLSELVPDFNSETRDSCQDLVRRRNIELHTGELAFENITTSNWLSRFYSACNILLISMGKKLDFLTNNASEIQTIIDALDDDIRQEITEVIEKYEKDWLARKSTDRSASAEKATAWATRDKGHRVSCPSCNSRALIRGTPSMPAEIQLESDQVIQKQRMLPSSFECIACGLKIVGLSKLMVCGLGDSFLSTMSYTPSEFFGLYSDEDLDEMDRIHREELIWEALHEPDYNE